MAAGPPLVAGAAARTVREPPGTDAVRIVVTTVVGVLLYAGALHWSYANKIAPSYAYTGLSYRTPDLAAYGTSVLLTLGVALALPRTVRRPSEMVLWVLFVVAGAPSILITQYADIVPRGEATLVGLNVAGCLLLVRVLMTVRPQRVVPTLVVSQSTFLAALLGVNLLIYLYLISINGINLSYLSLYGVYTVRAAFVEATSGNALLGYVLPVSYLIINPFLMARAVLERRLGLFAIGAVGQVLIYTTIGAKNVLFSIPAVLAAGLLFRWSRRVPGSRILFSFGVGISVFALLDVATGSDVLSTLFTRRFLAVPGALTSAYVEVFKDLPKTNFADSLLPFLQSPYMVNPTYIVGSLFGGSERTSANVNLWGHGFLSYGYVGMYVESAVLAITLWLVDDASRGLPTPVSSLVFLMPTTALADSSVFTSLLTHCFLAGIVLCALAPRTGWTPDNAPVTDRGRSAQRRSSSSRRKLSYGG